MRPFFLTCLCALLLAGPAWGQSPAAAPKPAKKPKEVRVGLYLNNLYDLNMTANAFYADFYLWFRWKGKFDPTNIEFVNAIEKWSVTNNSFGTDSTAIVRLKDSSSYRIFRIEGRFLHAFSLNRFPLDQHALDIQIENPDADADSLVYLPDTAQSAAVRPSLHLVGWEQKSCQWVSGVHDYGTNFGNPEENARKYSNLTYQLTLARPVSFFVLKMLLPLALVLLVSLGALLLHPEHIDTRSSLPIGGLLTAVFLQQVYSDALPDTGYMVLMDKIYLLAYFFIALTLGHVIVSGNWLVRTKNRPIVKRIFRWERGLAITYFVVFWLGVAWLCQIP